MMRKGGKRLNPFQNATPLHSRPRTWLSLVLAKTSNDYIAGNDSFNSFYGSKVA